MKARFVITLPDISEAKVKALFSDLDAIGRKHGALGGHVSTEPILTPQDAARRCVEIADEVAAGFEADGAAKVKARIIAEFPDSAKAAVEREVRK